MGALELGVKELERARLRGVGSRYYRAPPAAMKTRGANSKFYPSFLTSRNHLLGFGDTGRHGFFHNDMFASLSCADGEFRMHAVGQANVNSINIAGFYNFIKIAVIKNVFIRYLPFFLPGRNFVRA